MTKSRIWICVCAAAAVLLLLLGILWRCQPEKDPDPSVPSTSGIAASTTVPAATPDETTEPEKQMYWVFAYGGLWVRTGPGTGYELAGSLEDGEEIEVLTWKDGWAYIEKPIKGWCSGEYIHKLGWYKDVKTPEGTPPQDDSLKGNWVHLTTPAKEDGVWVCRAGYFLLRANGTFIHSVADYRKTEEGQWEAVNLLTDQPYWVGEYDFDGRQLKLKYMAELVEEYDQATGKPTVREWVEWTYDLTLEVTKGEKFLTIPNGEDIPLTVANEHAGATENTLFKVFSAVASTEDVCAVLDQRYS